MGNGLDSWHLALSAGSAAAASGGLVRLLRQRGLAAGENGVQKMWGQWTIDNGQLTIDNASKNIVIARRPKVDVAIRIPCKAKPCVTCGHKKTDCHASVRTGSQ